MNELLRHLTEHNRSHSKYIEMYCDIAKDAGAYHCDTEEELREKLIKENNAEHIKKIGNCLFVTNYFGVIQGIGFLAGDYGFGVKIWCNKNFGTFKEKD